MGGKKKYIIIFGSFTEPFNLSTFSSDTSLPISKCNSVLSSSVIGLSTLLHLQMNDWLALRRLPFTPLHRYESISCNHGTKLNYCQCDCLFAGLNRIYCLAPSTSNVTTTFTPHVPAYVESPKALLGPLLLIMYTSLSTLISSLSQNHRLYADDTQLFLSFRPSDFDSSVTHLQNALQHISSMDDC